MLPTETLQEIVRDYAAHGLNVFRIKPGEKRPTSNGWTEKSADAGDFREGDSVGILTGWMSDGGRPDHSLVCIDLDSPAALADANTYLPPTAMTDGRPGRPNAHRYYLVPNESIPHDAIAAGNKAAEAAVAAGKHPGP